MYFYLTGIDYKSSTIDAREMLYRCKKSIFYFWTNRVFCEAAVFTTCNRIEIYGVAECADDAFCHVSAFSKAFPDFSKISYVKLGEEQVFRHMLALGIGLKSQINAEEQILMQLNSWRLDKKLPFHLKALLDKALILSKNIRNSSGLSKGAVNIATLVFGDIAQKLQGKEKHKIIVIGTGKISELFAKQRPAGAHLTFIANKNYQNAMQLAQCSEGATLPLCELYSVIPQADIIISATSSPHYILKKEQFDKYFHKRGTSLLIYDLAMPRDVEPAIADIDGVCLYNLDTLGYIFNNYNISINEPIRLASSLVEDALGIGCL